MKNILEHVSPGQILSLIEASSQEYIQIQLEKELGHGEYWQVWLVTTLENDLLPTGMQLALKIELKNPAKPLYIQLSTSGQEAEDYCDCFQNEIDAGCQLGRPENSKESDNYRQGHHKAHGVSLTLNENRVYFDQKWILQTYLGDHVYENLGNFLLRNDLTPEELYTRTLLLMLYAIYAVNSVHQEGFIHRDIKPANLFIKITDDVPHVTLGDWGYAVKATTLVTSLAVMSEDFAAPECLPNRQSELVTSPDDFLSQQHASWADSMMSFAPLRACFSQASDLYSLGVTLKSVLPNYENVNQYLSCLIKKNPYERVSLQDLALALIWDLDRKNSKEEIIKDLKEYAHHFLPQNSQLVTLLQAAAMATILKYNIGVIDSYNKQKTRLDILWRDNEMSELFQNKLFCQTLVATQLYLEEKPGADLKKINNFLTNTLPDILKTNKSEEILITEIKKKFPENDLLSIFSNSEKKFFVKSFDKVQKASYLNFSSTTEMTADHSSVYGVSDK